MRAFSWFQVPCTLLALCLLSTDVSAQAQACDDVYRAIRAALRPVEGELLQIVEEAVPDTLPGTLFVRGQRIPPFHSAEDARPTFATVVLHGSQCALVASLADLAQAWPIVTKSARVDSASMKTVLLRTLNAVRLVRAESVLKSSLDAQQRIASWRLSDTTILKTITSPTRTRSSSAHEFRFFTMERNGVYLYTFNLHADGQLTSSRELKARLHPSL